MKKGQIDFDVFRKEVLERCSEDAIHYCFSEAEVLRCFEQGYSVEECVHEFEWNV